ncbi:MAG: carboxypeptidase-like regulatory domain-containing protein, partial [Terracidiphilus sp.]
MSQSRATAGFAIIALLLAAASVGAQSCAGGLNIEGTVFDPTGAAIAGAQVNAGSARATSNSSGHYEFRCINTSVRHLAASANGFETSSVILKLRAGQSEHYDFHLKIARVESSVSVGDGDEPSMDSDHGLGTHVLTEQEIRELSDDPNDFQRELQILAAANGGAPGAARITVDGFQNSSALPPKASIARIVTAPDLFSAEYDTP